MTAHDGLNDHDDSTLARPRRELASQLAALTLGLGSSALLSDPAQAQNANTLVVGMASHPPHLNSAIASGTATGIPGAQLFASPLRFDTDWSPQPYLARSWSFQDDGRSILLRLVENATFHDGKPITSEDVAFSIMTIKANHPFQSMFGPVERVDTPSPYIAVIRLNTPHPAILLALSPPFCPIIPKHIFGDGQALRTHPRNASPIGSGPYKLVSFKPREAIVLERHPAFFIPDRPRFDRVVLRMIADPSAMALSIERGEVDLIPGFPTLAQVNQLSKSKEVVVSRKGGEAIGPIGWLAFNMKRKPFDDVRVRRAIAYAIDKDFIIRELHKGITVRATGPIAPGSPFYTDKVEPYKLNLDKANQLLDAAGHARGAGGTRFAMAIDYLPGTPDNSQTLAEYLRPQLRKVGIEATVRNSPDFPTWARRISSHDFDVTMDSAFNYGDPVIGVHRTYLSSNIKPGVIWSNTQNYANPRVDDLLAQATVERDPEKRKRLYAEFQRIVVDEVPVAFTHVWASGYIARRSLSDVPASIWSPIVPYDTIHRSS
jgi:peptide/nickel transport system substrate-binding protein